MSPLIPMEGKAMDGEGRWEYQCRLGPYSDWTMQEWVVVDPDHRCCGELRRRWVGNWETVEK